MEYQFQTVHGVENEKYLTKYWSNITRAVTQVLNGNVGIKLSFEQMYGIIYKCVCDGYGERLHADLIEQCLKHVQGIDNTFTQFEPKCDEQDERVKIEFVELVHKYLEMYVCGIQQVSAMFAYLNKYLQLQEKCCLESSVHISVNEELMNLCKDNVLDKRIDKLIGFISELLQKPFVIQPATVSGLLKNLHTISDSYSSRYSPLFSRYVPCILPPMRESELPSYIQETKEMQNDLRQVSSDVLSYRGSKRHGDDDNYGPGSVHRHM